MDTIPLLSRPGFARVSISTEKLLRRYGVNFTVLVITAILVILSVIFSCSVVKYFQGYIDPLTVGISISAPSLLVPLPAKLILSMFARLKKTEEELQVRNIELKETLNQVKTLSGLLPICCSCKKIRNDKGYWNDIVQYLSDHSDLLFSHSFCPECARKLYPDLLIESAKRPEAL